jgi:hypothetical protein
MRPDRGDRTLLEGETIDTPIAGDVAERPESVGAIRSPPR